MAKNRRRRELPDGVSRLIKFKARQLVGHYGFNQTDRDDIEQDLAADLCLRLDRFDPARGKLKPFVDHLIKKAIATIIEHKLAAKRDYRCEQYSVDSSVCDSDGKENPRADVMDQNEAARRLSQPKRRFVRQADLALDLADFLLRLPPELRELSEHLKVMSPTEIARMTGRSRGAIYDRITLLRGLFEDAGLRKYLDD